MIPKHEVKKWFIIMNEYTGKWETVLLLHSIVKAGKVMAQVEGPFDQLSIALAACDEKNYEYAV